MPSRYSYSVKPPNPRGRPNAGHHRGVADALLRAAEEALRTNTPEDMRIREVATLAGTNEAMIRYYFNSKDGLLIAMLDDMMDHAPHKKSMEEIARRCVAARSIKPLVEVLAEAYYPRANIVRMIIVELMRSDSEVKRAYIDNYAEISPVLAMFSLLDRMQEAGIYRADLDNRYAVLSIMSILLGPITLSAAHTMLGIDFDEFRSTAWVEHFARTIDLLLS